ncbi:MAG: anaerobic sulfatase maturase [Bacteroidetes bacterium]|jgi:uncharacterized protein|nr:anaerobic sulfatase maturase [Bacteroidota bacterium]MBT4968554.1 anaerobic sulfatase maturase [Bacteroidota bacterium]MBT6685572.1 anaerobic sulfatase maturase [Bacteroidota bacterium]MBT7144460.1 anaerobic sulfatase maturase [Bacteroidota bacterium]MBT7492282.1 anaerobic sulfatase maturase [Bacteroidota bacterium]
MKKPLESIIVKPVGAKCNLNCDYCFYLEKENLYPSLSVMSHDTLEELIRQMSNQTGNQYNITWQGGEPSLAGIQFFRKLIDLQLHFGKTERKIIGNSLQTNGTLLNDEWISFLKKYNFLIGLSIDGTEEIHDKYRLNKNGKTSWKKVNENAQKLMNAGVAVNILSCITKSNVNSAEKIYQFYKSRGFQWLQFNPVFEKDRNNQILDFSVSAKELGGFMCKIFDLWYADFIRDGGSAPIVRFIENTFHAHIGHQVPECSFQKTCGGYLVVEHNGDVYSCDFFVNKKNKLGNIHQNRLIDMLNSKKQHTFGELKAEIDNDCKKCPWLEMCYGGCPKYRNAKNLQYFCSAYKQFFSYSNHRLSELAKAWKKHNQTTQKMTFDASGYFK